MELALAVIIVVLLLVIFLVRRHRNCATVPPKVERACGSCSERFKGNPNTFGLGYSAGSERFKGNPNTFGLGYSAGSEHMVPTFNTTFFDSLKDRSTDYYYDSKGLTMSDYALERRLLGSN